VIVVLLMRLAQAKRRHEFAVERLHEQTRKTAQACKEILESVSHDLKNPLTAIDLSLQLAEARAKDPGLAKPLETGMRAVTMMRSLIEQLLDQAKLEAGDLKLQLILADLREVISGAKTLLDPLAHLKQIKIELMLPEALPDFPLDRERIGQVLLNILGNAIKFTPPGGTIRVDAFGEATVTRVRIQDSGPGVPRDQLELVFDRFWQAASHKRQGTGLGLAIAKAIVDAHGGKIWAESEPGKGGIFQFTLPRAPRFVAASGELGI
jgi:signal transduction histidine kinase